MSLSFTAPRTDYDDMQREVDGLSPSELKPVLDDVYGSGEPVVETPEFVKEKICELQDILDVKLKSNGRDSEAYRKACRELPDFVKSDEFRLMFLRSELFDVTAAATKMITYWKMKLKLFGEDLAFHPKVKLDDLSQDDLAALRNQGLIKLPGKDEANRGILISTRRKYIYRERENMARLLWYLLHLYLEEESTQQNGLVVILFDDGDFSIKEHFDRKLDRLLIQTIRDAVPIRLVGFHHCFDSRVPKLIMPFLLFLLGRSIRLRYRLYYKDDKSTRAQGFKECKIPMSMLPTSMLGEYAVNPDEFIAERRAVEN